MPLADSFSTCENLSLVVNSDTTCTGCLLLSESTKNFFDIHKIVYNPNVPLYLKSLLTLQYKYNQTRSENKWTLKLPKIKNSYGSRAFSFLGPKKWNALPSHLRCIADHILSRKELKTFLFSSSY